jgi:hypothetical protein
MVTRAQPAGANGASTDWLVPGASTVLELRLGDHVVTLLLSADPEGRAKAFARAAGLALVHVEPRVPASLAPALERLVRMLAEVPLQDLSSALPALAPATLVARRALFSDQVLPHWPASQRSGPGVPGCLWPYDAELAAHRIGARALIRREWAHGDPDMARDEAWLARHGLTCRSVAAPGGRVVVLAAIDLDVLREAERIEPELERPGPRWEAAASAMGRWLGYPECCVRRFASARSRSDAALFSQRLPPPVHGSLPPETCFLNGALAVVSHVPCAPECESTRRLGHDVCAELARAPGFASWHERAARVHAITRSGRVLALACEGSLATSLTVRDALELVPGPGAPSVRPLALGTPLTVGGLELVGLPEACTLFADHRGVRSA